jgi:hypothetical protein
MILALGLVVFLLSLVRWAGSPIESDPATSAAVISVASSTTEPWGKTMEFIFEFGWIAAVVIGTLWAVVAIDMISFIWAFVALALIVGGIVWHALPSVEGLISHYGWTLTIGSGLLFWIVMSVITSFIYWVFFCWRLKERYEESLIESPAAFKALNTALQIQKNSRGYVLGDERETVKTVDSPLFDSPLANQEPFVSSAARYFALWKKETMVFSDAYNFSISVELPLVDAKAFTTYETLGAAYDAAVNQILPPKFSTFKRLIIWSGIDWPATLLWILFARFIRQIVERIVTMFGGTFNKIGKLAFGKF